MQRIRAALRHLVPARHLVEAMLGRRLPLPSFAVSPARMPAYAAQGREDFKSLYHGRSADLFFANDGPVIHKWLHYFAIYDQLLEPFIGTGVRMLEIGVSKGGSLGLWRKFLGPKAVIFGIDVDPSCAVFDGQFAGVRIGSQDDPEFLRKVVAEMGGLDVLLDDGSHIGRHQRASFDVLFPLLSEGGLYIIEDMHSSYWSECEGGMKKPGTAIEFLKDQIDDMHRQYRNPQLNKPEFMTEIESIQFFDSIAVVRKRRQLPRFHMHSPE
jgi:hypothetical protein